MNNRIDFKNVDERYCLYDNKKRKWFGIASDTARRDYVDDADWFDTLSKARRGKKELIKINDKNKSENISIVLVTQSIEYKEVK